MFPWKKIITKKNHPTLPVTWHVSTERSNSPNSRLSEYRMALEFCFAMLFNGFSVIPRVRHATSGTIETIDQQLKPKTKGNYDVILKDFLLLIVRKEEIKDTIFEISFTLPTALIFLHISLLNVLNGPIYLGIWKCICRVDRSVCILLCLNIQSIDVGVLFVDVRVCVH